MEKVDRPTWPTSGKLEFRDLHLRYAQDMPDRLRGITCVIPDGLVNLVLFEIRAACHSATPSSELILSSPTPLNSCGRH